MGINSKSLKIFLCDLTYDTIILVSDTIPINIGFIGSYAKKNFGNKISIELFKYPNDAIKSINLYVEIFRATILDSKKLIKDLELEKSKKMEDCS